MTIVRSPNLRDQVKIQLAEIPSGTSRSGLICPSCLGGVSREKSFSVTNRRDGVALYICHRATCGYAGRIETNPAAASAAKDSPPLFVPRFFTGETHDISPYVKELLGKRYGLTEEDIGWFELKEHHTLMLDGIPRLLVPIRDCFGALLGYESRALWGDCSPKTYPYRHTDAKPWMGWFYGATLGGFKNPEVVMVEDVISAMAVSRVVDYGVSLMGTHLDLFKLMEVVKYTDNIVLALDRDATEKAFNFQKKYQFLCPHLKVLPLERDLKYLTSKEIEEKLREYRAVRV